MMSATTATNFNPRTTLEALPAASEAVFPGLHPWSPISTAGLTKTLRIDRGNWGTWRCRGITPAPMPQAWFRRLAGRPVAYRVDTIRAWLAGRRGEPYDAAADWQDWLATKFDTESDDPAVVRRHAAMYARATGPVVGDVVFTPAGFTAYLDNLAGRRA